MHSLKRNKYALDLLESLQFSVDSKLVTTISSADLLDSKTAALFLESIQPKLFSPTPLKTASLFVKRYAFVAVIAHASYSFAHVPLSTRLIDWKIVEQRDSDSNDYWAPKFTLHNESRILASRKEVQPMEYFANLYHDHYRPIVEQLFSLTKVPKVSLWETVYSYLSWLYESLKDKALDQHVVQQDFEALLQLPGEVFGMRKNPFLTSYQQTPVLVGEYLVKPRKTCCFYHESSLKKGEGEVFCGTCPHRCRKEGKPLEQTNV